MQLDSGGDSHTYAYDAARRLTSIDDPANPTLSWTYEYNDTDQLTSAEKSGTTTGWTHDANGNRVSQSGGSAITFTVAAANNRLSSTSGGLVRTYTYDSAGNTKTYSNRTLTFNNRGRMSSMKVGTATTNYVYNALGYRVKKTGSIVRLLAYDEQGHLIGEYDGAGALIQETVWLDDVPLATLRPKTGGGVDIFYVHTDHLNTPRKITRPSDNAVMWQWEVDAFGQALPNENPSGLGTFAYNPRFAGQYYDVESGLHYNHHRDYDPATGRYVESDPIGLKGGLNTYSYVGGAPQLRVDPSGLAVSLTDYDGSSNTNCCVDGVMTICMDNPKNGDLKCSIVRDSMEVHERSHQAEFQARAPTICAGVRGKRTIGYTTWEEWKLSELTAFNVQLDYLANRRRQACVSPTCEEEIPQYMNWIMYTAIPAVINGTYGR